MSFLDKLGLFTDAYGDVDEDEYYDPGLNDEPVFETVKNDSYSEPEPAPVKPKKKKKERPARRSVFADDTEEIESEPIPEPPRATRTRGSSRRGSGQVVDLKTGTSGREFVIFLPTTFEEGVEIIDHMMYGRIVLVNEERLSPELSRRMTDSLSGAAYALGGKLLRVGSLKAVVFTPHGVALLNDQLDELESSVLKF